MDRCRGTGSGDQEASGSPSVRSGGGLWFQEGVITKREQSGKACSWPRQRASRSVLGLPDSRPRHRKSQSGGTDRFADRQSSLHCKGAICKSVSPARRQAGRLHPVSHQGRRASGASFSPALALSSSTQRFQGAAVRTKPS